MIKDVSPTTDDLNRRELNRARLENKFWIRGNRSHYILMYGDKEISKFTNKERARGVQYFLEENPLYSNSYQLLKALEAIVERSEGKLYNTDQITGKTFVDLALNAIAKSKGKN